MKTVPTIVSYLEHKYARENITAKRSNGQFTYLYKGEWISEESFNLLFPIAVFKKLNDKGENVCKKHSWKR